LVPIEYVNDTSSWEDWQREYLHGAFYIFPPDEVIDRVDDLRERYDPRSAAICQAHISLTEPLARRLTAEDIVEVTQALRDVAPFVIRYGPLRTFGPHPGVVYAISPEEHVRALRSTIQATSLFARVDSQRDGVAPHMTIAEFISLERTEVLLAQLQGSVPVGEFICDQVEYALPDATFCFRRVLTIPLGHAR
jgi:2'-5' RNA ligase